MSDRMQYLQSVIKFCDENTTQHKNDDDTIIASKGHIKGNIPWNKGNTSIKIETKKTPLINLKLVRQRYGLRKDYLISKLNVSEQEYEDLENFIIRMTDQQYFALTILCNNSLRKFISTERQAEIIRSNEEYRRSYESGVKICKRIPQIDELLDRYTAIDNNRIKSNITNKQMKEYDKYVKNAELQNKEIIAKFLKIQNKIDKIEEIIDANKVSKNTTECNIIKPSKVPDKLKDIEDKLFQIPTYDDKDKCTGIYFLLDFNCNIVYIGKSIDVFTRIKQHRKEKVKVWCHQLFLPVDEKHVNDYEAYYINKIRPIYNKVIPHSIDITSKSQEKIDKRINKTWVKYGINN